MDREKYVKNTSWEAIDGGKEIKLLSSMNSAPTLKFKIAYVFIA